MRLYDHHNKSEYENEKKDNIYTTKTDVGQDMETNRV